jgi:DNA-binding LacI/PurR family transcriptional regulator
MVTLKQIADAAHTSVATVSMALRDSPRISQERKDQIASIAKRLDYRRNAHVSTLMRHIRRGRTKTPDRPAVAILLAHPDRDARKKFVFIDRRCRGIESRLAERGYRPAYFWYNDPKCPPERLERILHARGIRGVVLAFFRNFEANQSFHWSKFAVASHSGFALGPMVHRVSEDCIANTVLAMTRLWESGCRRIGLAHRATHARSTRFHTTAAYHEFMVRARTPLDRMPSIFMPEAPGQWTKSAFMAWFHRERPDAILTYDWEIPGWLEASGCRVPAEVSVAVLNQCPSAPELSGIDSAPEHLGKMLADLVVDQLENNELGPPLHPKLLMVPGRWISGTTTRPLSSPPDAPLASHLLDCSLQDHVFNSFSNQ